MSRRRKKDSSPLERGRRLARAAESIRVMRRGGVEKERPHRATLSEAEATLSRLRDRQVEIRAADEALDELEAASRPETIAQKLASKGFGPRGEFLLQHRLDEPANALVSLRLSCMS